MIDSHTHIYLCAARATQDADGAARAQDADGGERADGAQVDAAPARSEDEALARSGDEAPARSEDAALARSEDAVVARALEAGVTRMLNIGLNADANRTAIGAAERHDAVFAAVGCHPTEASGFDEAQAEDIAALAAHDRVRAVGEMGIDYYRDTASPADQRRAFEAQVEIAVDLALPIVIHARDPDGETRAIDEVFAVLDARAGDTPVILHCFSAPWRAEDAIERGWFCSFAGHTTYPGSTELREAAERIPDELILVETDAPYLAPQTVRGKPNEPAYVVDTARLVAEVRGTSYEDLERAVEANARALFGW